jgi:hypothetical protein
LLFSVALAFVLLSDALHAQQESGGGGSWGGGYYGGTVYSHAAHGFADIVRSAGSYNLTTSEAYKNLEDTRRKYIENRLLWTQTYFEMRRINDEYRRAAYERDKRSHEYFIRYAQAAAPRRLTSSQLDPITGYLAWPRLLLTPAFAEWRRDLERLLADRVGTRGAIGEGNYFLIRDRVNEMQERLRQLIKDVPTNDYIDANRFLDSLAYEVRFPTS